MEPVEGPGQRHCHSFVSGDQQGLELISDLCIAHGLSVVVAGSQQEAQHRVLIAAMLPPGSDLFVEELLQAGGNSFEAAPRTEATEVPA